MADRPRVSFTHGSIAGVVVARKRYRCDGHLSERHHIEPGEQYVASALPPDNPEINNDRWWHLRVCLDCCPVQYDSRPAVDIDGAQHPTCRWTHPHGPHEIPAVLQDPAAERVLHVDVVNTVHCDGRVGAS